MRPMLLDTFCKAGGASTGYYRAGFDVIGVDIEPQPRYPFPFIQADALDVLENWRLESFAAIHASPICKGYSVSSLSHRRAGKEYPNQIPVVRKLLERRGVPYVIENVPGAPLRPDWKLCGCFFGLPGLRRERWFETNWPGFVLLPAHNHDRPPITVAGHGQPSWTRAHGYAPVTVADWRLAMGIDWMTRDELAQAIPPAYTEQIGTELLKILSESNESS